MVSAHAVELKEGWSDMAKPSKTKKEMREEANENKRHLSKAENAKEMTKKAREEAKKEQYIDVYYPPANEAEMKEMAKKKAQPTRIYFPPAFDQAEETRKYEAQMRKDEAQMRARKDVKGFKKGGKVKGRRGDGICQRGRTRGRMV